ncbi:MAG: hypothetical protein QM767_03495 [Anaeromyxobacter sp.]
MSFRVHHPFRARPTAYRGLFELAGGFKLRRYTLTLPGASFDESRFARGVDLALAALPAPAVTAERPGVGFMIEHQGRDADYVVVAWWDRENELAMRTFTRAGMAWREARDGEGLDVWNLRIVTAERDAYVADVLTHGGHGVEAYLARGGALLMAG